MNLLLGDCISLLVDIPDGQIDMMVCDLPYGTTSNKWDSVIPFADMWREFLRACKPNAAMIFTASQPFTSALVMSMPSLFRHEWIWIKNAGSNFANTVREPMKEHESVLVFSRGKWTYNKQMQERTRYKGTLIGSLIKRESASDNYRQFTRKETKELPTLRVPSSWQKFNRERGLHPTQKPVELVRYFIRTYSNADDLIFDPTMGSGTTAIAAHAEGRRFVGIEQDPFYFDVAAKRIADACSAIDGGDVT